MSLNDDFRSRLSALSTPHLADACMRVGTEVRCAPARLRPLVPAMRCVGTVRPARHVGSVDIFLEALEIAAPGDVLVVDNGGRIDQACVGDLVILETALAGLAGAIVWGLHRDTSELLEIGLPLFSLGTLPTGPQGVEPRTGDMLASATIGDWIVTADDVVAADVDGVIFLPEVRLMEIVEAAESIADTERRQAAAMRSGRTFRDQASFGEYLLDRASDPTLGFRDHLRKIGGAIEE